MYIQIKPSKSVSHWMLPKLVSGNGEQGTGVWERVNSGNPPENSKWRRKQCLQKLILSLGRRLQHINKSDDLLLFKYFLGEATKPIVPR